MKFYRIALLALLASQAQSFVLPYSRQGLRPSRNNKSSVLFASSSDNENKKSILEEDFWVNFQQQLDQSTQKIMEQLDQSTQSALEQAQKAFDAALSSEKINQAIQYSQENLQTFVDQNQELIETTKDHIDPFSIAAGALGGLAIGRAALMQRADVVNNSPAEWDYDDNGNLVPPSPSDPSRSFLDVVSPTSLRILSFLLIPNDSSHSVWFSILTSLEHFIFAAASSPQANCCDSSWLGVRIVSQPKSYLGRRSYNRSHARKCCRCSSSVSRCCWFSRSN